MRKTYGLALIALHRNGETIREGDNIRDMPLAAGDTLVVHTAWDALARLEHDRNFVVVTTEYPHEEERPHKVGWAGIFFAIALSLVLFTDLRLSVALLTGAIGMVLSRVLKIEEACEAVSWKTVIMGPGGYRVPDFMKAGGIMTILFLVVSMVMMNLVF